MSDTMRGRGWRAAAWRMVAFVAAMVAGAAAKADTLVPWADSTWKYKVVPWGSERGFQESGFDDSAWPTGRAPFAEGDCGWPAPPRTPWQPGTDLIARLRVNIACPSEVMRIRIAIDNAVQVWVNGVDISNGQQGSGGCAVRDRYIFTVPVEAMVSGTNMIAVRATDGGGASYFDMAIDRPDSLSVSPKYIPVYDELYRRPSAPIRFTALPYRNCAEGLGYRWQRRDVTVIDGNAPEAWINLQDDAQYAGTATAELTILAPNEQLAVPYRCTMLTPCLCNDGGVAMRPSNPVSFGMVQNVVAWGDSRRGQLNVPGGTVFEQVVVSGDLVMALRTDGTLLRWGGDPEATTIAGPNGQFSSVAAGCCGGFMAIRDDGTAAGGWAPTSWACPTCPPTGTFRKLVPSWATGVGIRTDGTLAEWAYSSFAYLPPDRFIDVAYVSISDLCYAIREDGSAIRFSPSQSGVPPITLHPGVTFKSASMGRNFAILHATDGTLRGDGVGPGATVPTGVFLSVAAGDGFAVAVRSDGTLLQWGSGPGPVPAPPPGGFRRVWASPEAGSAWAFTTDACADRGSITILREPGNLSISPAGQAVLSIEATGPMPLTYRWRRNGLSLSNDARFSGVDSPVLTINGFRSEDQARYDCVLSDQCRLMISRAADVSCRPFISGQPQGADVAAGLAIRLGVEVTTGGSISYRWRRNGVNLFASPRYLGVNTGLLTILTDDPNDSGLYSAVTTNACGTTTSVAAQVTVFCAADFNQDGGIDGSDVAAFFENWEQGEMSADVNADGGIDGSDVDFFFDRWERGC